MSKTRSFTAAVWKEFSGSIKDAVADYIDEYIYRLNLGSYKVPEAQDASLSDLYLHRVIAYDTPGNIIEFDAIVTAHIEICRVSHSQSIEDDIERWFRVSCEATLDNGFSDFSVKAIEDYYDHRENPRRGVLKDTLVPVIYADELEKCAEDILKEVYPEALEKPLKIDVRLFAKRMGLVIEETYLSRNKLIFGGIVFNDSQVDCYDPEYNCYETLDAAAGTILVDPEVFFLRALGSCNNTIIHECVHWKKHRKVFELEKLYSGAADKIVCQVDETMTAEGKRTDIEWMEWHANSIAPRVMMPRRTFSRKADEYIDYYKQERRTDKLSDVISDVISDLADFFGASMLAAKIRMIDVGYTEAIGVYEYIDDRYVPAYAFGDGAITRKQTFSIPVIDALVQYTFNRDFRRAINSGNFVYIDSHYCIRHPKYVKRNKYGVLEMTPYAVKHIDECCLVFNRTTRPNADYGVRQYTESILFQNAVSKNVTEIKYSHTDRNKAQEAKAVAMNEELDEAREAAGILRQMTGTFCESLVYLMKWRRISVEKLAEHSLLSVKTIQRMRNEDGYRCDIETVIAVCVGLRLPSSISMPLIEKAGHKIKVNEKEIIYSHLLATHYQSPIFEFNEYLEAAGYLPLSGNE